MKLRNLMLAILCGIVTAGIGHVLVLRGSQPLKTAIFCDSSPIVPAKPVTVDEAAYNAKMLELANLRPGTGCAASAVTAFGEAPRSTAPRTAAAFQREGSARSKAAPHPCIAPLWPPRTAYPDAGALLPFKRIVAYYGNFYSPRMGILGEYSPDKVLELLESTAAAWAKADPSTPTVPAIDYIAVSAQGAPGRNGKYMMRMPPSQIQKALSMANQIHGLLFLDVQPGWSTVEIEVPRLAPYLKLANVELALDPEFALPDGKRPGAWRGAMTAADINFAARFLAKIVQHDQIPPKILVVHRFTQRMVTDFQAIKPLPEVEIVMDMDGFGSPALKVNTYKDFIASQPVQFTGFKLFYKNDVEFGGRLMTPAEILRLSPRPSFILYQ